MNPAKEVGGDFYDFFLIDENTLAVVIADVSGKGIPAALFMANSKTLIKSNTHKNASPKEILKTVNDLLCESNDEGMFVTVFMGILDIPSRRFAYANAAHCPPLINRDGSFEVLTTTPGAILGFLDDADFPQNEIILQEGDTLCLWEFWTYHPAVLLMLMPPIVLH